MADQETNVTNRAQTTLTGTLAASATTINVSDTSAFPAVPFYAVLAPEPESTTAEVVLVDSSKTGTTFVLSAASSRGLDGTTDQEHPSGTVIAHIPVAALWTDVNDRIDAVDAAAVTAHNDLTNRDAASAHPQSAITDLVTDLSAKAATTDVVLKAGSTMSGDLDLDGNVVRDPQIRGDTHTLINKGNVTTGTSTLAYVDGPHARIRNNGAFTLALPAASELPAIDGTLYPLAVIYVTIEAGTTPGAVTWDSRIDWGDAGAPTLSTTALDVDLLMFTSFDRGADWIGTTLSQGHAIGSGSGTSP